MNHLSKNKKQHLIIIFVFLYVSLQVVIPLRHFVLPKDSDWYKVGDKFSWYLVRNFYKVFIEIHVIAPRKQIFINHPVPEDIIIDQISFHSFPGNFITYARYIKEKYAARLGNDVEVHVVYQVRLNGRPFYPYVDYRKDLTKVSARADRLSEWILPHPDIQAKNAPPP